MSERARAVVARSSPGRARLYVDNRRGDERFFSEAANVLLEHPGVDEVRASTSAASLLILHHADLDAILTHAQARELFDLDAKPSTPIAKVRKSIDVLDDQIAKSSDDTMNLGKVMFVALLGAGIWQIRKGYILPAGLTVFNYALKAMEWGHEREVSISRKRP